MNNFWRYSLLFFFFWELSLFRSQATFWMSAFLLAYIFTLCFLITCIIWIVILCQINSCQRFSSLLWVSFSPYWLFLYLCRRFFFVLWSGICQLLSSILGKIKFYSETLFLPISWRVLSMFSSIIFSVSVFMFGSLIHLDLFLCILINIDLISFFQMWICSFPSIICWRCFLFSRMLSVSLLNIKWLNLFIVIFWSLLLFHMSTYWFL